MKKYLFLTLAMLLAGCASHYITNVYTKESISRSKYKSIAIRSVYDVKGIAYGATDIVETIIKLKVKNAGFAIERSHDKADAVMDIGILKYKSYRKWSPGTSDTHFQGYYDKKDRWHPGYTMPGFKARYYESGDVSIHLELFDVVTDQLIWECSAHGSGIPSQITDDLLKELVDCMKLSLEGNDCDSLMK